MAVMKPLLVQFPLEFLHLDSTSPLSPFSWLLSDYHLWQQADNVEMMLIRVAFTVFLFYLIPLSSPISSYWFYSLYFYSDLRRATLFYCYFSAIDPFSPVDLFHCFPRPCI